MIIIIFFSISECQNYASLNNADRKITYALFTTIIVTEVLDLVGFVLRGQPAHDCQLHVHRKTDAALRQPPG